MDLKEHLQTFRANVVDHPSEEETVMTWKILAQKLPLEPQTRLLTAWNKQLAGVQSSDELVHTINHVIRDLEQSE